MPAIRCPTPLQQGHARTASPLWLCLLAVLSIGWAPSAAVKAAAPSGFGTVTRSRCVWRGDSGTCAWNLLYPFVEVTGSLQVEDVLEGTNARARSLLQAAVGLEYCAAIERRGGGPEACKSTATVTVPTNDSSTGSSVECEWRQVLSEDAASLLRQLLAGGDGDVAPPPPSCVPTNLEGLLQPYLSLIGPERCGDAVTVEACSEDPRCTFEDHDYHSDCMVDYLYGSKLLSYSEDDAALAPLPQATLTAQHDCNPESFWTDSHGDRPAELSQEECGWRGSAELDLDSLFEVAAAAGIPLPSSPPSYPGAPSSPAPPPSPPSAAAAAVTTPSVAAAPPPPVDATAAAACAACASCPAAELLKLVPQAAPPLPPPPTCNCAASAAPTAPAPSTQQSSKGATLDVAVLVYQPACGLDARNRCVPTLLNFATAAVAAVAGGVNATTVFSDMPSIVRQSMEAAYNATRCILNVGQPSSTSTSSTTSTTTTSSQQPNSAAVAACVDAALASHPAAAKAFTDIFSPPCGQLAEAQCEARAGCVLEAHDGHNDCVRSASYASDLLLVQHSAAAAAAAVQTAVAGEAQRLADTCRVISRSSCPLQQLNMTLTRSGSLPLLAAAAGIALPPAEAADSAAVGSGGGSEASKDGGGGGSTGGGAEDASTSGGGGGGTGAPLAQQQGVHDHDDHGDDSESTWKSKQLRIGAVFAVLVAGLVGCFIPLVLRDVLARMPLLTASLRAMCAGLILSLALIHVASHAVSELSGLIEGEAAAGEDAHGHRRRRLLLTGGRLQRDRSFGRYRLLQQAATAVDTMADVDYGDYHDDVDAHADEGAHEHPFPIGMCTIVFGYLLMVAIEHVTHVLVERYGRALPAAAVAATAADGAPGGAVGTKFVEGTASSEKAPAHDQDLEKGGREPDSTDGNNNNNSNNNNINKACCAGAGVATSDLDEKTAVAGPNPPPMAYGSPIEPHAGAPQFAVLVAAPPPPPPSATAATPLPVATCCKPAASAEYDTSLEAFRLAGMASMFELGCVLHSFLIGLLLGTTPEYGTVVALMCALVFHQLLEGIGLGTVLAAARLPRWRLLAMVLLYAVTCPIGIAVGIGISDTYDSYSVSARAVQGTLNGISAGLLLYLASAMIACDFGAGAVARWRVWERALLFGVMCAGAALFAMLAIWA